MLKQQDFFAGKKDEVQNQYSTFIQELEKTAEQLMQEVFQQDYNNQQNNCVDQQTESKTAITNSSSKVTCKMGKFWNGMYNHKASNNCDFEKFMHRNHQWVNNKNRKINAEIDKKKLRQDQKLIFKPHILRGSKQKTQPIYQRCIDLHKAQQKKFAKKRIQKSRQSQEQISRLTFQPQLKNNSKNRTIEEYIRDKYEWQRNRIQNIEVRKLVGEASKYDECTFKPNLVSKNIVLRTNEKIQIRLLRSLQK